MSEIDAKTRDTKERILDSAEKLFADHGFAATSLRGITTDADVNLAAVNYHFGSKEALVEAVMARRLEPLNRERLRLLDELEAANPDGKVPLERIVEAFIGPPLRWSRDPSTGGAVFMRLLGHATSEPSDAVRTILTGQFEETLHRFLETLKRARPDLGDADVLWRMVFMVGAMAHTMAMSDQVKRVSDGICDPSDVEGLIDQMVPFLAAGLQTPTVANRREEQA